MSRPSQPVPSDRCPNCGELHAGLVSSCIHEVTHCGCFYEADPAKVWYHISDPLEQALEREYNEKLNP